MNQRPIQGSELEEWKKQRREKQRLELVKLHQEAQKKKVEECLRHFNLLQK